MTEQQAITTRTPTCTPMTGRPSCHLPRQGLGRISVIAPIIVLACILMCAGGQLRQASLFQSQETVSIESADAKFAKQNWKDALRDYKKLLGDAGLDGDTAAKSLRQAELCLRRLNDQASIDALLKSGVKTHGQKPQVLDVAADIYLQAYHYGTVAGGKFVRGYSRGYGGRGGWAGRRVNVADQDRSQAIALRLRAIELLSGKAELPPGSNTALQREKDGSAVKLASLHLSLAKALLSQRSGSYAWRLAELTSLDTPNYREVDAADPAPGHDPPADPSGDGPLLHEVPEAWATAATDGERVRYCLSQASLVDSLRDQVEYTWANHLATIYSVATIRSYSWMLQQTNSTEQLEGRMQVHTLADNESIAKLASGVQRFELPDDYCHITLWQKIAERDSEPGIRKSAMVRLTEALLNRRQYEKAAQRLEREIALFGDDRRKTRQALLDSIRNPRLKFDAVPKLLAGEPIQLSVVSRNADSLKFSATQIDLEKLISTWKAYHRLLERGNGKLPSKREDALEQIVQSRIQPNDPSRLFQEQTVKHFLTNKKSTWEQDIEQRADHWDRRDQISGPQLEPGAYLVDVSAGESSLARVVVWVEDTALVQVAGEDGQVLLASDLATGAPATGISVEYFGYGQKRQKQRAYVTSNFARRTDTNGSITVELDTELNWLTIARRRADDGKVSTSILGAQRVWRNAATERLEQYKAYAVSDRPIYKPGETVKVKLWLARTGYGDVRPQAFANTSVAVHVIDPKGSASEKIELETDADGGTEFDFPLNSEATLGYYYLAVTASNGQRTIGLASDFRFRLEEYRKPEFEVLIEAPEKPIALGETVKATLEAKYYFGAPVAGAAAVVRVERAAYQETYYPVMPYDWFYGNGYWWTGGWWDWHPTVENWRGCMPAPGPQGPAPPNPVELLSEQTITLDENGRAEIEFDSAEAKAFFGNSDHQYTITARVTDAARRTQTATGQVIAARKPFQIYAWTDKGYYRAGEQIEISFDAKQLSGPPVAAAGTVELFKLSFETGADGKTKVIERSILKRDAATNGEGSYQFQGVIAEGGQYRAELRLNDGQGRQVAGGHIFTVRGNEKAQRSGVQNNGVQNKGLIDGDFKYSGLELTPDRKEYAPGETVNLLVASDYPNARVGLFIRPTMGAYPKVQWIQLDGKSVIVPIKIDRGDMPNFFIEAISVHGGDVHKVTQQIFVPPSQQLLTSVVSLDKEEYQPGEDATATIRVTDESGQPATGTCVLAVYDRSLEALAADSLPADMKVAFWKMLRRHFSLLVDSRSQTFYPTAIRGIAPWSSLGVFGWSTADDVSRGGGDIMNMAFGAAPMAADAGAESAFAASAGMGGPSFAKTARSSSSVAPAQESVAVRKNFADAAVWVTRLELDENGTAKHSFKMPENLTSWRVKSWTMDRQVRVGSGETTATTRKPLLVRLAAPRFLIENDRATIAAIVRNDFDTQQQVSVSLQVDGETQLRRIDELEKTIAVPAHGEARVQWEVEALAAGEIALTVRAIGNLGSDATLSKLPINVYGALKTDAYVGTIRPAQTEGKVRINVPENRKIEHSRLVVKVSPTLAMAMVDSLPYLIEYPYGCTEQTLNRFLPAVLTQQTLRKLNVDLESIQKHRSNLNTQQISSDVPPNYTANRNPTFDAKEMEKVVDAGLRKLTNMQLSDGGWGWFSGGQEQSSVHTTATAVRGLLVAQQNGVAVVPDTINRGLAWMENHCRNRLQQFTDVEIKASINNSDVLAIYTLTVGGRRNPDLQKLAFEQRANLSLYGKVLLALVALETDAKDQLTVLRQNIEQFLVQDTENETAFLKSGAPAWYWYGSEIEANAMYLKLLAKTAPKSAKASRVVKYLLNNRRHATYWHNTRDTALVVEAMADFIAATGEGSEPTQVTVLLGDKRLGEFQFTRNNLFTTPNTLTFNAEAVPSGTHDVTFKRTGGGNLYYSVYLTNFTQEEKIEASGLELKVERKYYKLVPRVLAVDLPSSEGLAKAVDRRQVRRVALTDGEKLPSGTLIEVELLVQSKNDYEYVMLRDDKPAGLEATDTTSGYEYGSGLLIYKELRSDHVAMFCQRLPQGNYSLRYQLRTETPGQFTAPPASVTCMYADELRGSSSNAAFTIDR